MNQCRACFELTPRPFLCVPCARSYDRSREKADGSIMAAIEWGARRAHAVRERDTEAMRRQRDAAEERAKRLEAKLAVLRGAS